MEVLVVLAATAFVALVWVLGGALLIGLAAWLLVDRGAWKESAAGADAGAGLRWLALAPAGCGLAVGVLQVWNLARPVDGWAAAALALAGVLGWVRRRRELAAGLTVLWRRERTALLLTGCVGLWFANIATGSCDYGDTGMYHLPMARWLAEHSLVPGLANLHGRFGFNNASLLFAALFEGAGFAGRSHHFANGPLVLPFLGIVLCGVRGAFDPGIRGAARVERVFLASLLPVALYGGLSRHLTSLSTDLAAALVLLFASWRLLGLWIAPGPEGDPGAGRSGVASGRRNDARFVVLMLSLAVAIKLPAAPFAAMGTVLAFLALGRAPGSTARHALLPLLLALGIGLPWLCRGVLLSGYPAYPANVGGLDVEWRVPAEQVEAEHAWALSACRMTGRGDPGGPWVADWVRRRGLGVLGGFPALLGVGWLLLAFAFVRTARGEERAAAYGAARPPGPLALVLVCGACLVIWFLTGPNPRFGFGIAWSLAASCAATWVWRLGDRFTRPALRTLFAAVLVLSSAYAVRWIAHDPKLRWRERWLVREAGADLGLHPYRDADLESFETESGLRLHVPRSNNNAWGGPLPNTPYPASNLRLREVSDLGAGFVTEGPWAAERWPKQDSDFLRRWRASREE